MGFVILSRLSPTIGTPVKSFENWIFVLDCADIYIRVSYAAPSISYPKPSLF